MAIKPPVNSKVRSIFTEIANSRMNFASTWIKDGKYVFIVRRLFVEKKRKGETFIAELYVKESQSVGAKDAAGRDVVPNAAGTSCGYVVNMTTHPDTAGGNIKALMLALLGYSEEEADAIESENPGTLASTMQELCNDDPNLKDDEGGLVGIQPARGMMIADETFQKENQGKQVPGNAGKMLTLHAWTHVEQTPDEISANRAMLDELKK